MKIFLETPRLVLRQFTPDDAQNLLDLDSDIEVIRYVDLGIIKGGEPLEKSYEDYQNNVLPKWLQYYQQYPGYGFWAAIEKSSQEFIGWFHLRPALDRPFNVDSGVFHADEIDLGYRLRRVSWGKGYATEGSRALVSKGFNELGTQCIVSSALADNRASSRVMEKAGLKFELKYVHPEIDREVVKYSLRNPHKKW
ncbi:GNAT family N-acetyltransferase [Scytonema millei]|uniref:GNAT family N-acetyltransferase n=1 Tax=Scytonema millei VB511283 TaxID=1245923 RepID=A0A9X5I3Z0_9CYAN|nr:GNAT family N-acetyltransferase [Scytonema millei]NHC33992.1 GNAT family N-acetyltransferase [Scytonema millei VB511283]